MIWAAKIIVLANLLCAIFLFIYKSRQNSPFQFFYLTLAGLVIWPGFFEEVGRLIHFHPSATPVYLDAEGFFLVHSLILGHLIVFMGLELSFPLKKIDLADRHGFRSSGIIYSPFFLLLAALGYIFFVYGAAGLMSINMEELRFGTINSSYLFISYLTKLSIFLPAYLLYFRGKVMLSFTVMAIIAAIYLLLGGSRQSVIVACFLLIYFPLTKIKHGNFWIVLIFLMGFGALDVVLSVVKMLRNVGDFEGRLEVLSQIFSGTVDLSGTSSESLLRPVLYSIVTVEPVDSSFREFSYLGRTLLFWMPSAIDFLGIKPADFEANMFSFIMRGREGSMHPTYFGSTFADAGYAFPVWCLVSFFIMRIAEREISRSNQPFFLWSLGIYFSMMSARGALYAVVVVFFVGIVLSRFDNIFRRLKFR